MKKVVEYTYDVFNRRIAKEIDTTSPFDMQDAAIERFVYDDIRNGMASLDGGNVVLDFVGSDGPGGSGAITLSKRYLWGEGVDELLAQEDVTKSTSAADRVLWQVVDHLGTVRALVKQDGTAATKFVFDAFGGIVAGDTSLTRYLFTSREFDADTGLQYNRARWYDAATGRWLSEDPLGFAAGDVNTARYVGNRVVGNIDPSGLSEWARGLSQSERHAVQRFLDDGVPLPPGFLDDPRKRQYLKTFERQLEKNIKRAIDIIRNTARGDRTVGTAERTIERSVRRLRNLRTLGPSWGRFLDGPLPLADIAFFGIEMSDNRYKNAETAISPRVDQLIEYIMSAVTFGLADITGEAAKNIGTIEEGRQSSPRVVLFSHVGDADDDDDVRITIGR